VKAHSIVVGYDGSIDAQRALEVACEHASEDTVVHVVTAYRDPDPGEVARTIAELPEEFRETFDPVAFPHALIADAGRLLDLRGARHVGHVVDGDPADAIIEVAGEVAADLIVVGSRGYGRWQRKLHHSVSAKVAKRARTSLMIVRSDAAVDFERPADLVGAER
jgi:nucleotide-binding universal stress UspA family protein